jgi:hypothetical protein
MSEVAAAPVAPAPQNGAPRNNAGQFSPKAGATGIAPTEGGAAPQGDGAPPSGPQSVAEWEGYEGEVEVYGEKQAVKVKSKAEALRAHQELLAYRKRVRDIAAREKQFAEFDRLSPDERAKLLGVPVDDIARRKVLEAAKRIDMTPEQIELEDLREYKRQQAQREEEGKKAAEDRQKNAERQQRRAAAVSELEKGLQLASLPKTHASMALLAEIQQEATAQGLPPLPPDLLAQEATARYRARHLEPQAKMADDFVASPTPEGATKFLETLGKSTVRAVLLAEKLRRGLAAGNSRPAPTSIERELPTPSDKTYGEGEAEAKLRELRNRR